MAGRNGNRGIGITFFNPTNPSECGKAKLFVNQLETYGQPVPEFLKAITNQDDFDNGKSGKTSHEFIKFKLTEVRQTFFEVHPFYLNQNYYGFFIFRPRNSMGNWPS